MEREQIYKELDRIEYRLGIKLFPWKKGEIGFFEDKFNQLDDEEKNQVDQFLKSNKKTVLDILRKRFTHEEREKYSTNNFIGSCVLDDTNYGNLFNDYQRRTEQWNEECKQVPEIAEKFDTPFENLLQCIERDAERVLKQHDFITNRITILKMVVELELYGKAEVWDDVLGIRKAPDDVVSAIQVLSHIDNLRSDIDAGRTEQAVARGMQIIISAVQANLSTEIFRGIRAISKTSQGGRSSKSSRGIELFVLEALSKNPSLTEGQLKLRLERLRIEGPWEREENDFEYKIYMDTGGGIQHEEMDLMTGKMKPKALAISTIQKKYLPRLRKGNRN